MPDSDTRGGGGAIIRDTMMKPIKRILLMALAASVWLTACQPMEDGWPTPGSETATETATETAGREIIFYTFVEMPSAALPEGSVVILEDRIVLAPAVKETTGGADPAGRLREALEAVIADERNGWTSPNLVIGEVTFHEGHAEAALEGDIHATGDVLLIAARMQILMTIFAEPAVQTARVTIDGECIGNLGISQNSLAKPDGYIYPRSEIELFMASHAGMTP